MDFSLSKEQRAWQMKAREFSQEEIRPISLARDAIADPRETWDWNVIKKGSQLGFRTLAVSKKWGGHQADFVTQALVMTELAKGDSAIAKALSQNWKFSHMIESVCTQEQKERFLRPFIADDTYLLGTAGTEPNAGSDNRIPVPNDPRSGWRLKAERDGDEWILNGEKCFTAHGTVAKLFFIHTRTNPNVNIREGSTLFMVPTDTPGFRVGKIFNKSGWRFYQNAELVLNNARLPHTNIMGEVNGGVAARNKDNTEFGDLELAANALGVCEHAVEMAMRHTRTRTEHGKPVMEQQLVQLKLSEMHMLTEALRNFVMRIAWERDQALPNTSNNVLAMNFATDAIQRVTRLNLDIHGGHGPWIDAGAEKLVRDAVIWTHLAGDSVQRMKVIKRIEAAAH